MGYNNFWDDYMKKYSFRLQKLLNLENQREHQEEIKLQTLISEMRGQETMLESLKESLSLCQKELSGCGKKHTDAQQFMVNQNYIIALNERIGFQGNKIAKTNKRVSDCRDGLLEIQKNRKTVEKLRDKGKEEYVVETRKKESKQLDDISIGRQFFLSNC